MDEAPHNIAMCYGELVNALAFMFAGVVTTSSLPSAREPLRQRSGQISDFVVLEWVAWPKYAAASSKRTLFEALTISTQLNQFLGVHELFPTVTVLFNSPRLQTLGKS